MRSAGLHLCAISSPERYFSPWIPGAAAISCCISATTSGGNDVAFILSDRAQRLALQYTSTVEGLREREGAAGNSQERHGGERKGEGRQINALYCLDMLPFHRREYV